MLNQYLLSPCYESGTTPTAERNPGRDSVKNQQGQWRMNMTDIQKQSQVLGPRVTRHQQKTVVWSQHLPRDSRLSPSGKGPGPQVPLQIQVPCEHPFSLPLGTRQQYHHLCFTDGTTEAESESGILTTGAQRANTQNPILGPWLDLSSF